MSNSFLTQEDLKKLAAPFPKDVLGVKVQSTSKAKDKAMLVIYVQHTDVMNRLDEVDPAWSSEITEDRIIGDIYVTRMKLTVKGVSRENVGEGNEPKSAASDALKRCAMMFGVSRYLYDQDNVWVPYSEQNDRYRVFTIQEYEAALRPAQAKVPAPASTMGPKPSAGPALVKPKDEPKPAIRSKAIVGAEVLKIASQLEMPQSELAEWATEKFGKPTKELTVAELEEFKSMLLNEAGRNGVLL